MFKPGQITPDSDRGQLIYNTIVENKDIGTIVEIGTWNGKGSTLCVMRALMQRPKCNFYTLEVNESRFLEAKILDPMTPNIHYLLGRIIEVEDFSTEGMPEHQKSVLRWLPESISDHNKVSNVLHKIPSIIDFLILDGGEFSTRAEWEILRDRTEYVFLDDIECLKNILNHAELMESKDFEMIEHKTKHPMGIHNGYSLFKRINK